MSTPLDLDAMRERIQDGKVISVPEIAAAEIHDLISEVEALRKELDFTKQIAIEANLNTEAVEKLYNTSHAKLEKAKEALLLLRNAETNGSIRCNGVARCKIIREALAELEKP